MPLFGTLQTMALPDLLQWLATARMTGTLQVERNKVSKTISFHEGQVVGCSSEDPPELLGQFLLARGKLSEEQLSQALNAHERERTHLGGILVKMGVLSQEELSAHLEAKAEETIFSLFDWQDAVFRFQQGEAFEQANTFPVRLRVEDVLLRGLKRFDEIQRIREVFDDPGIVLRHTTKTPPRELFRNRMARALYEAIDGDRTVAEILLHVHGSEYTVTKFLFELHRNGYAEIAGVKRVEELPGTPAGSAAPEETTDAAPAAGPAPPVSPPAATAPAVEPAAPVAIAEPPAVTVSPQTASRPAAEPATISFTERLERVRRMMSRAEFETALDLLDELYREAPGDESLRRLSSEAEAAFIEKAYRHYLPPKRVPCLTRDAAELEGENLSPTEFFLLSRIDGVWDLKSIVQIAPLREVEVLRTLKRLREAGVIELREPE